MLADLPNWNDWRWQLRESVRDPSDLRTWLQELGFDPDVSPVSSIDLEQLSTGYQLGITPYYLSQVQELSYADPILKQILPAKEELHISPDELDDPIGDEQPAQGSRPCQTIIHRHPDRVLFMVTSICAVYCRYCFRKRLVGKAEYVPDRQALAEGIEYIRKQPGIREVILTGGDPLVLADSRLAELLQQLDTFEHVRSLRIHTRLPVVNPFRLTPELADIIATLHTPTWMVSHFNHPQELQVDALERIGAWIDRGIPFLNQSVLLRGINDSPEILEGLCRGLIENRIKPYYLHHADLVKGTSHLRTSIEEGLSIMKDLQGRLPGHAIPTYVLDRPGGLGKIPLQNGYRNYNSKIPTDPA